MFHVPVCGYPVWTEAGDTEVEILAVGQHHIMIYSLNLFIFIFCKMLYFQL